MIPFVGIWALILPGKLGNEVSVNPIYEIQHMISQKRCPRDLHQRAFAQSELVHDYLNPQVSFRHHDDTHVQGGCCDAVERYTSLIEDKNPKHG